MKTLSVGAELRRSFGIYQIPKDVKRISPTDSVCLSNRLWPRAPFFEKPEKMAPHAASDYSRSRCRFGLSFGDTLGHIILQVSFLGYPRPTASSRVIACSVGRRRAPFTVSEKSAPDLLFTLQSCVSQIGSKEKDMSFFRLFIEKTCLYFSYLMKRHVFL
jgi:hypothetical protein